MKVNYIELLISIHICRSLCKPSTFSGGGGSTITRVEGCWGLSGMTPLRRWWKAIGSILAGGDADTLKTTVFLLSDLESDSLRRKRSSNCWGGETVSHQIKTKTRFLTVLDPKKHGSFIFFRKFGHLGTLVMMCFQKKLRKKKKTPHWFSPVAWTPWLNPP